jgi:hypothetical protein
MTIALLVLSVLLMVTWILAEAGLRQAKRDDPYLHADAPVALAKLVKRRGYRLHAAYGFDMGTSRWYDSLSDAVRGWSRIFLGLYEGRLTEVLHALVLTLMSLLPLPVLVGSVVVAVLRGPDVTTLALLVAAAAMYVLSLVVTLRMSRFGRCSARCALLRLPASVIMLAILGDVLLKRFGGQKVTWRGKRYDMGDPDPD